MIKEILHRTCVIICKNDSISKFHEEIYGMLKFFKDFIIINIIHR